MRDKEGNEVALSASSQASCFKAANGDSPTSVLGREYMKVHIFHGGGYRCRNIQRPKWMPANLWSRMYKAGVEKLEDI